MQINNSWDSFFIQETSKEYYTELKQFLHEQYKSKTIYPPIDEVYSSFYFTPLEKVKIVILGQDPYHQPKQACGLSFSVNKGVRIPPSLKNIYKELNDDLRVDIPSHGNLVSWAKQGVFLLNTVLTVEDSKPNSHKDSGWQIFTDEVIKYLSLNRQNIVFILWGKNAQSKTKYIDQTKHLIISSVHPSPLSAYNGFFGSKPFSKANQYLSDNGIEPIDWSIND